MHYCAIAHKLSMPRRRSNLIRGTNREKVAQCLEYHVHWESPSYLSAARLSGSRMRNAIIHVIRKLDIDRSIKLILSLSSARFVCKVLDRGRDPRLHFYHSPRYYCITKLEMQNLRENSSRASEMRGQYFSEYVAIKFARSDNHALELVLKVGRSDNWIYVLNYAISNKSVIFACIYFAIWNFEILLYDYMQLYR